MKKANRVREKLMQIIFMISAVSAVLSVLLICVFIFANGFPVLGEINVKEFFFGVKWAPVDIPPSFGILPMIVGSIYVTVGAIIVGVPIGILTAIFMAKYCPPKLYKVLKPATELLAGIPSVVYGFFGMVVLVPFIRNTFGGNGNSILTASLLLGMMILPTIIGVSEASIRSVPESYYEGAVALGASKERSIFLVTVKAASSGIITSVILGIGRAIGETMAVIMVAGNQPRIPDSILKGVRTLTANVVIEMGYAAETHRQVLFMTAVVLLVLILIINLLFSKIEKRGRGEKKEKKAAK